MRPETEERGKGWQRHWPSWAFPLQPVCGLAPSLPTSLAQAESPRPHGIAHGPQDAASEAVWYLNLKMWKTHVFQSPEPDCNF